MRRPPVLLLAAMAIAPAHAADPAAVAACLHQDGGFAAARDVAARRPAAPDSELAEAALAGMLAAADPEADIVRPGDAWPATVEGTPGLDVAVRGGRVLVLAARDGGPAAAAGLRPGDVIEAVDGAPLDAASRTEAERRLDGPPGSAIVLRLRRGAAATDVSLTRIERQPPPPPSLRLVDGAGVLRLPAFAPGTLQAVRRALADPAPRAWVLDLRGTARGQTEQAMAVADLFLTGGTLATRRDRGGEARRFPAQAPDLTAGAPLALLVDAGTAGAAEVLAAALQDAGRAMVVGQASFGLARDYQTLPLPDGGGIRIATGAWIRPSGTVLTGIEPDVPTDGDALAAALTALGRR